MLLKETICRDLQSIIQQYYYHEPEPLFSVLSEDCVWLSVGNLLVSGKQAIMSCFEGGFVMPKFIMENPDFRRIETGSEDQLLVLGQFYLYPEGDVEDICAIEQRISCCCRQEGDHFLLYHMHVSNEWNEMVEAEVYAVRMGAHTYRYVQKRLKEQEQAPRLAVKRGHTTELIDTSLLIYAEAMDKQTILHMAGEIREINVPFKEILELLPPQFCRSHRSYAVNCAYIIRISRYALTLATGEQLPIPKIRYNQIAQEIESRFSCKQQTKKLPADQA